MYPQGQVTRLQPQFEKIAVPSIMASFVDNPLSFKITSLAVIVPGFFIFPVSPLAK